MKIFARIKTVSDYLSALVFVHFEINCYQCLFVRLFVWSVYLAFVTHTNTRVGLCTFSLNFTPKL